MVENKNGDIAALDKKKLIQESYKIEGIQEQECRSIFFDWMLSSATDKNIPKQAKILWKHYAPDNPMHPMTQILFETMNASPLTRGRKGGRKMRIAKKKGE